MSNHQEEKGGGEMKKYRDEDYRGWYIIKKSRESGKLYKVFVETDEEAIKKKMEESNEE